MNPNDLKLPLALLISLQAKVNDKGSTVAFGSFIDFELESIFLNQIHLKLYNRFELNLSKIIWMSWLLS